MRNILSQTTPHLRASIPQPLLCFSHELAFQLLWEIANGAFLLSSPLKRKTSYQRVHHHVSVKTSHWVIDFTFTARPVLVGYSSLTFFSVRPFQCCLIFMHLVISDAAVLTPTREGDATAIPATPCPTQVPPITRYVHTNYIPGRHPHSDLNRHCIRPAHTVAHRAPPPPAGTTPAALTIITLTRLVASTQQSAFHKTCSGPAVGQPGSTSHSGRAWLSCARGTGPCAAGTGVAALHAKRLLQLRELVSEDEGQGDVWRDTDVVRWEAGVEFQRALLGQCLHGSRNRQQPTLSADKHWTAACA